MATIELKKARIPSDVSGGLYLKDNGVAVAWTSLEDVHVHAFSVAQNAIAGPCTAAPDESDPTRLNVTYPASTAQYPGVAKLVVVAKYHGRVKSYDVPVVYFVKSTEEVTGYQVIDDPEVDVAIQVEDSTEVSVVLEVADVSTSLLDQAIQDAEDAADAANAAAQDADAAATAALAAKEDADTAAAGANTAKQNANSAAGRANSSATNANNAAAAANAAAAHGPKIENNTWWVWDATEGAYVDTEVVAIGQDGHTPVLTADSAGNIYADGVLLTDVLKQAKDTAGDDHTRAAADHTLAASDHTQAAADHTQAASDHTQAASDHTTAAADHTAAGQDHTRAGEEHTLAAADHTTAGEDHTLAAADHVTAAADHTLAGTDHQTAAADHTQAESDHARAESDHQSIADKADVDGYYQQMTVGLAENLVDTKGTGSEQEFIRRTSCGDESIADDGAALFKELQGNTLVWNQIIKNGDFSDGATNWSGSLTNRSASDGVLTAASSNANTDGYVNQIVSLIAGHKYYISFRAASPDGYTFSLRAYNKNGISDWFTGVSLGEAFTKISGIKTGPNAGSGASNGLFFNVKKGKTLKLSKVQLIDLTQMFGAGNEPSTVAEFEALFPEPYYAYNAGTLINNKASKYVTDGFNQWDEVWERGAIDGETGQNVDNSSEIRSTNYIPIFPSTGYFFQVSSGKSLVSFFYDKNKNFIEAHNINQTTRKVLTSPANAYFLRIRTYNYGTTYNNDICINLSWSGYRNGEYEPYWKRELALNLPTLTGKLNGEGSSVVVFPEGMKSAGNAYDYGIIEDGYLTKLVKVIAQVDLGALTWETATADRFASYLEGVKRSSGNASVPNLVTELFAADSINAVITHERTNVMSVSQTSDKCFIYPATTYNTPEAFASAVSGILCNYELATPLVYILDNPIPMVSKVADFGTETIEPQGVDANGVPNTAPFRAVIKYNDDFTRKIATMEKNFTSKETVDALLSCLGGALNGTITKTWDATNNKWTFTFTPNA